jgi:hypothetical protein
LGIKDLKMPSRVSRFNQSNSAGQVSFQGERRQIRDIQVDPWRKAVGCRLHQGLSVQPVRNCLKKSLPEDAGDFEISGESRCSSGCQAPDRCQGSLSQISENNQQTYLAACLLKDILRAMIKILHL